MAQEEIITRLPGNLAGCRVDQPFCVCRDLWQLRAQFSRLSSSLLSSWDSVASSLLLSASHLKPSSSSPSVPPPCLPSTLLHQPPLSPPPPLSSTLVLPPPESSPSVPPLDFTSTLGTFSLGELEHKDEEEQEEEEIGETNELKLLHQTEVSQLEKR